MFVEEAVPVCSADEETETNSQITKIPHPTRCSLVASAQGHLICKSANQIEAPLHLH
jgi:hypothetical protein